MNETCESFDFVSDEEEEQEVKAEGKMGLVQAEDAIDDVFFFFLSVFSICSQQKR